jgi:outer membrane protein
MRKSVFQFVAAITTAVALASSALGGSDRTVRTETTVRTSSSRAFTLEQAIETALQRNPDIQRARQEIERNKGIYIEMRAQALPRVDATGQFTDTDPHLFANHGAPTAVTINPVTGVPETATLGGNSFQAERSYNIRIEATQVIFAGGRIISQIRAADFGRDASYYAFRNAIDLIISTVRQQFYQVLLNRALIGVQEESVQLLESQLRDQQNRFEAGTVPRFNVLQAQVALSNQIPVLITARNTYRISQLQLAKTIGLDFDPNRGDSSPIDAVGELQYQPRGMPLALAIETAKERRPFLKQQKANILGNNEQVRVARSGYFPQINATGGEEVRSSSFSDDPRDVSNGYIFGATGSWAIWDWGQTYGRTKQARAVLQEAKISYDDAVRQVELEVQQAFSNMQQGKELIQSQAKNVEQAEEALRLASARLQAGAGTQLEVLNARVEVTTAQSNQLQSLYTYNAAVAEFDRVTATEATYSTELDEPGTRAKLKTDALPTPPPKPTPLPLNGRRGQTVRTMTTTRSSGK